jgi:hypothetical protein
MMKPLTRRSIRKLIGGMGNGFHMDIFEDVNWIKRGIVESFL